jgi:hypothetical protein
MAATRFVIDEPPTPLLTKKTKYRERRTDPEYQGGYHKHTVCELLKPLRRYREVAIEIYLARQCRILPRIAPPLLGHSEEPHTGN